MAPAVLSTGVFLTKGPFHPKFARDPANTSLTRILVNTGNKNSRDSTTKTAKKRKKSSCDAEVQHGSSDCTPLSVTHDGNVDGSPLKKRRSRWAALVRESDGPTRGDPTVDCRRIISNGADGKDGAEELPSSAPENPIISTIGDFQSSATPTACSVRSHQNHTLSEGSPCDTAKESGTLQDSAINEPVKEPRGPRTIADQVDHIDGFPLKKRRLVRVSGVLTYRNPPVDCSRIISNGTNGKNVPEEFGSSASENPVITTNCDFQSSATPTTHSVYSRQNPPDAPSEFSSCDTRDTSTLPLPESRSITLLNSHIYKPAKEPREPRTIAGEATVAGSEPQSSYGANCETSNYDGQASKEPSNLPQSGSGGFNSKIVATNFSVDGLVAKEDSRSQGEQCPASQSCSHPIDDIPTVVQEFSGAIGSGRCAKKRKNGQKRSSADLAKEQARSAALTKNSTLTGGKVTVNSTLDSNKGTVSSEFGINSWGYETTSLNVQSPSTIYNPRDSNTSPMFDDYCCSSCAVPGLGFAAGCGTSAEVLHIDLEKNRYSAAYLRSIVPYRREGFIYPQMKFKCLFCSQLFPSHDDLQGHVDQRHYGDYPYECPFCLQRFDHTSTYSGHLNEHIRLQDYPTFGCRECSACFSSKWEHDLHVVIHDRLPRAYGIFSPANDRTAT